MPSRTLDHNTTKRTTACQASRLDKHEEASSSAKSAPLGMKTQATSLESIHRRDKMFNPLDRALLPRPDSCLEQALTRHWVTPAPSALMARSMPRDIISKPRDLITHQANRTSKPYIELFLGEAFLWEEDTSKGGTFDPTSQPNQNQKSLFHLENFWKNVFWGSGLGEGMFNSLDRSSSRGWTLP